MSYLGDFTTANTVYVYFNTFDSNDPSASVTLTGLATTDIKVYKNGSITQRASEAGYTLLDTDGIDFDALTGIHGFSIDLSNNTDAGFFVAGGEYVVVVASVTVDAATVNFVAATFSIERTGGVLALAKGATGFAAIDTVVDSILADTGTDGVVVAAINAGAITATAVATGAIDADALAADAVAEIADGVWDEDATGHQTQGTFGQAIGDPVADTNTIFKAVVTDATGATVGVDVVAVKAETVSIQSDTDDLQTKIGTPAGASIAADLAVIDNFVDDLETTIGAAGAGLTALATAAELAKVPKSDGTVSWNATALAAINTQADSAITDATIADGTLMLKAIAIAASGAGGGKVSGAGTGTETFRNLADTAGEFIVTVDSSGNRTAVDITP